MNHNTNLDKCVACSTCVVQCPVSEVTSKFIGPRMLGPASQRFRLLNDGEDILLLTSLASDQAIRTANIVGAMCVVVHNAKPLPQTMCQVADTLGIPLVSSPLSKYDSCVRIHDFLAKEG